MCMQKAWVESARTTKSIYLSYDSPCQGIWHPSMSLDRFKLPASPPGCVAAFPYAAQQQQHGKGLADRHLCVLTVTGRISRSPRIGRSALGLACCMCLRASHRDARTLSPPGWLSPSHAAAWLRTWRAGGPEAPMCCWCLGPGGEERRGGAGGEVDPLARSVGCAGAAIGGWVVGGEREGLGWCGVVAFVTVVVVGGCVVCRWGAVGVTFSVIWVVCWVRLQVFGH